MKANNQNQLSLIKKETISQDRLNNQMHYFPKPDYIAMNEINLDMKERNKFHCQQQIYIPSQNEH